MSESLSKEESEFGEFADWLALGLVRGWVSEPMCNTHSGLPLTEVEEQEFEEGFDPCVTTIRVWLYDA
jgi:hypothetical protein